jgi:hypothetical protein
MWDAEVRASAIFALGCLIEQDTARVLVDEPQEQANMRFGIEQEILGVVHDAAADGAVIVRVECAIAIGRAASLPGFIGSRKRHHILLAQAFEKQHDCVMEAYTAQQNLLMIESQRLNDGAQTRRDVPRAPASEGAVTRSELHRRLSDGRCTTIQAAQVEAWNSNNDTGLSPRPVSRTLSGVQSNCCCPLTAF